MENGGAGRSSNHETGPGIKSMWRIFGGRKRETELDEELEARGARSAIARWWRS